MTEQEAIEKIHSVYPTGCKNGLENMRALMAKLGNPQERLTMVHVAGTNGKGSCCAMTERVLRAAGYKTGLYTSPYIEVYNERIRLNGEPIAGEKLAALVESVHAPVCEGDVLGEIRVKRGDEVVHVGIMAAAKRVDPTGAGDFYAAGFLSGLTEGLTLRQCGTIGAITAGKVIEVVGTTFGEEAWQDIFRLVNKVKHEKYLF